VGPAEAEDENGDGQKTACAAVARATMMTRDIVSAVINSCADFRGRAVRRVGASAFHAGQD
jgi:hypothetical protein